MLPAAPSIACQEGSSSVVAERRPRSHVTEKLGCGSDHWPFVHESWLPVWGVPLICGRWVFVTSVTSVGVVNWASLPVLVPFVLVARIR